MKTIEEILQRQLQTPVKNKAGATLVGEGGEPLLPMEAMVMSVMQHAMQGDIGAINFIRTLTRTPPADDKFHDEQVERLAANAKAIRAQLEADGTYEPSLDVEIERLANTLLVVQRLEEKMTASGHDDLDVDINAAGRQTVRLSAVDDIRARQLKQFGDDLKALRATASQRAVIRRRNKR